MRLQPFSQAFGFAAVLTLIGDSHGPNVGPLTQSMHYSPIDFTMLRLDASPQGSKAWLLFYDDHDNAVLELHFSQIGAEAGSPILGEFRGHQPPGDWDKLLAALVAAHQSSGVAVTVPRYEALPFSGEVLASRASRSESGEIAEYFSAIPLGDWLVARLMIEPHFPEFYRGRTKPRALQLFLAMSRQSGRAALIPVDSGFAPLAFSYFAGLARAWRQESH